MGGLRPGRAAVEAAARELRARGAGAGAGAGAGPGGGAGPAAAPGAGAPCLPYAEQGPLLASAGAVEQACQALLRPGEPAPAEVGVVLKLLADMWQADPWRSWPVALVLLRRLARRPEAPVRARAFDVLYNLAVHSDLFPGTPAGASAARPSGVEVWVLGALSVLTADVAERGEQSAPVWDAAFGAWLHLTSRRGGPRPGCAPYAAPRALLGCMCRCLEARGQGLAAEHRHFSMLLLARLRLRWGGDDGQPLDEAAAVRAAVAAGGASGGAVGGGGGGAAGAGAPLASEGEGFGSGGLAELARLGGAATLRSHYAYTSDSDVKAGMFAATFSDAVAVLKARGALRNSRLVEESQRLLGEAGGPGIVHTWIVSGESHDSAGFRDAVRARYRNLPKLRAAELGAVLDQLVDEIERGVASSPAASVPPDLEAHYRSALDTADAYAESSRSPECWQRLLELSGSHSTADRISAEGFAFCLLRARQHEEAFPGFIMPGTGGTHIQLFLQKMLQGQPRQVALFAGLLHRTVVHHCSHGRLSTSVSIISSGMDWVIGTPHVPRAMMYSLCRLLVGVVCCGLDRPRTLALDLRNAVDSPILPAELPQSNIEYVPASLLWRPLKALAKEKPVWPARQEAAVLPAMLGILWGKMGDSLVLDEYLTDSLFLELLDSNHAYIACHCALGLLAHWKKREHKTFVNALASFKESCSPGQKDSPYHQALYMKTIFKADA